MARDSYIYIITNRPDGTLYIGVTNDLVRSMYEHRCRRGSAFAARYNLTHLVYLEQYLDIYEAISREKQLKRWRREKKVWLIEQENPAWEDLCREWFDD